MKGKGGVVKREKKRIKIKGRETQEKVGEEKGDGGKGEKVSL